MAGIKVITPPAVEPVTLADIKPQLRIDEDDTDFDLLISPWIPAARQWCEEYQNRAYITQTLELALDDWPCRDHIELPRPPLQSVTSLIYTDTDGTDTTWGNDNYIVDDYAFVARLVRKRYACWPSVCLADVNGVKVQYIAGYGGTGEDVPEKIRQAIILLAVHWYENGMCDPPPAVYALLSLDRVVPV